MSKNENYANVMRLVYFGKTFNKIPQHVLDQCGLDCNEVGKWLNECTNFIFAHVSVSPRKSTPVVCPRWFQVRLIQYVYQLLKDSRMYV